MNKKTIFGTILILSILFFGFFLIGCEETPTPEDTIVEDDDSNVEEDIIEEDNLIEEDTVDEDTEEDIGPEEAETVVDANNQFALELYSKFNEDDNDNIFFSPYSISTAFAMTYEGARGQTAEEMQAVFHFPKDDDMRRTSFSEIYNQINKKDKEYQLHTANALWAQQDYTFLPEYFNVVEQYYGGKVTNVDFKTNAEGARQMINDWVEEQTNDKIKDIIPPGVLSPLTRLVLSNAIYFKGTWVLEFDKKDTYDEDFMVTDSKTIKAPMMMRTDKDAKFNYMETEEIQMLEMLYKGEELSMLVILPKENDLASVEATLTTENLDEWRNQLSEQRVMVYMPKFKFETKYFMGGTLVEMGMPTAFTNRADFSGMDGTRNLSISEVIHQAFVEVNEEGTEAAAATVIIMASSVGPPPPIPVFRADHPFIFIIQERETGNILFMGRVVDPTAE